MGPFPARHPSTVGIEAPMGGSVSTPRPSPNATTGRPCTTQEPVSGNVNRWTRTAAPSTTSCSGVPSYTTRQRPGDRSIPSGAGGPANSGCPRGAPSGTRDASGGRRTRGENGFRTLPRRTRHEPCHESTHPRERDALAPLVRHGGGPGSLLHGVVDSTEGLLGQAMVVPAELVHQPGVMRRGLRCREDPIHACVGTEDRRIAPALFEEGRSLEVLHHQIGRSHETRVVKPLPDTHLLRHPRGTSLGEMNFRMPSRPRTRPKDLCSTRLFMSP